MKGVTTGGLSRGGARWKCNPREDAGCWQRDEKTLGALLGSLIDLGLMVHSVVGRRWSFAFGQSGAVNGTPAIIKLRSNLRKNLGNSEWGPVLLGQQPPKR